MLTKLEAPMQVYRTTIQYAIADRRNLAFSYQSNNDTEPRNRVIQPYIFGRKPNNKEFVFGLQIEGGLEPGLRMYDFSKMVNITMIEGTFDQPEFDVNEDQWLEIFEAIRK